MKQEQREELKRLEEAATPGPWTFDEEIIWVNRGDEDPEIHTGNFEVLGGDSETIIANVNGCIKEGRTNAKLIAAAPEMLAALKAFVHWYAGDSTEFNRDMAFYAAEKAIAKAGHAIRSPANAQ